MFQRAALIVMDTSSIICRSTIMTQDAVSQPYIKFLFDRNSKLAAFWVTWKMSEGVCKHGTPRQEGCFLPVSSWNLRA